MSSVSGTSLTSLFNSGVNLPPATTQANADTTKLFNDFDSFLLLLTQQLKNQDPLEPMDTSEFTNQLVQFANVEQSIKSNSKLDKLIAAQKNNINALALSYLGKEVSIEGKSFNLGAGETQNFSYFLSNPALYQKVRVTVLDENNRPVRTVEIPNTSENRLNKGLNDFVWDGRTDQGNPAAAGRYSLSVLGFKSADETDSITTIMKGTVESVGTEDDTIYVTVDDLLYPESRIISVNEPKSPPTSNLTN